MKTVGEKILEYRVACGITQLEMAHRMNECRTTISRAEQGLPMFKVTETRLELELKRLIAKEEEC